MGKRLATAIIAGGAFIGACSGEQSPAPAAPTTTEARVETTEAPTTTQRAAQEVPLNGLSAESCQFSKDNRQTIENGRIAVWGFCDNDPEAPVGALSEAHRGVGSEGRGSLANGAMVDVLCHKVGDYTQDGAGAPDFESNIGQYDPHESNVWFNVSHPTLDEGTGFIPGVWLGFPDTTQVNECSSQN